MAGLLLIPRSDPSVVLQLAEQALDEVAFLIEMPVAGALLKPVTPGQNHRLNLTRLQPCQKLVGVIALVGQQRRRTIKVALK